MKKEVIIGMIIGLIVTGVFRTYQENKKINDYCNYLRENINMDYMKEWQMKNGTYVINK